MRGVRWASEEGDGVEHEGGRRRSGDRLPEAFHALAPNPLRLFTRLADG
jgi:hypothetical protein